MSTRNRAAANRFGGGDVILYDRFEYLSAAGREFSIHGLAPKK
jgi:hypothetical protein